MKIKTSYAFLGAATVIIAPSCTDATHNERCNVLLVLVDDMGYSDLGCYGNTIIETPNLDALAENGIRINQFYSAARSSPSRASLLTGLYCHQSGMGHLESMHKDESHPAYRGMINDNCVTIAEVVRENGYYTGIAGKWHIGGAYGVTAHKRGFDNALVPGNPAFYYSTEAAGETMTYNDQPVPDGMLPDNWYSTDLYADQTIRYINEAKAEDKPFFLYLAFNAPHFPIQAPQDIVKKYDGKYDKGWEELRKETYSKQLEIGITDPKYALSDLNEDIPDWAEMSDELKDRMTSIQETYAAAVDNMDQAMGRVVEALRECGELDNTMIIFLSDNGANAEQGPYGRLSNGKESGGIKCFQGQSWAGYSNTPFRRYKHFTLEGGISSPCIIHYPNAIPRSMRGDIINHSYGCFMDIMPTIVEVTGSHYPTEYNGNQILPMEGESIMSIVEGGELTRQEVTFWEHEGNKAVREGDWKAVSTYGGRWYLYNVADDRTELYDLSTQHPDKVERFVKLWDEWAARCNVEKGSENRNSAGQMPTMKYQIQS